MKALILIGWMLSSPALATAGIWEELSPEQQARLERGEQVFVTQDVAGKPWPKAYVYRMVNATPEECAALFTDYESAKDYIKDVKKSRISKIVHPRVVEVDYTLSVPILKDEHYTVRNTLTQYVAEGAAYQVAWELVRATSTKSSEGHARWEPRNGKTIFAYYNFVVPGSGMADMVKGRAMKQVQETVKAIGLRVEKLKTERPDELAALVEQLRENLGSN